MINRYPFTDINFAGQDWLIQRGNQLKSDLLKEDGVYAITIGYDPSKRIWMFIDANQLPTKYCSSVDELVMRVMRAESMSANGKALFTTKVFAESKNNNSAILFKCMKNWWGEVGQKNYAKLTQEELTNLYPVKTLLLFALSKNEIDLLNYLLNERKVDLNEINDETIELLFSRAVKKGHVAVAEILLKTGKININQAGPHGSTPLFVAINNGDEKMVELLLKNNTDPNQTAKFGVTPLSRAIWWGHLNIVRLLVNNSKIIIDPHAANFAQPNIRKEVEQLLGIKTLEPSSTSKELHKETELELKNLTKFSLLHNSATQPAKNDASLNEETTDSKNSSIKLNGM